MDFNQLMSADEFMQFFRIFMYEYRLLQTYSVKIKAAKAPTTTLQHLKK